MRSARCFHYIRNLAYAFYRLLQKLSINTHQVVAYWRVRISRRQKADAQSSETNNSSSNVRLTNLISKETKHQSVGQSSSSKAPSPGQPTGLSIKTSNSSRFKLHSLFRRLSLRNLMEYCVIALNEASSSSCTNKFDLSSCDQLVWLLGQQYQLPQDAVKLVDDIRSKLWITYRRNFPPIDENARYTTDKGFGCMIRCGQMVLANALLRKNLGREWRWCPNGLESNPSVYTTILKLFQDKEKCPYSIHNIVRTGQQEGKIVGEWFGPNTIAQALKRISIALSSQEPTCNEVLISIDAALDNVVVVDEIKSRFMANIQTTIDNNSSEIPIGDEENGPSVKCYKQNQTALAQWIPGILFIQLRLGLTKINPLYFAALKKTFQFKNSLGIIGGRPNHALYLVGYTDDDIIYLDPHSTQHYIDFDLQGLDDQLTDDSKLTPPDSTYHCASPEKMPIDRLDPSLALCFYFHTEEEFDEWCRSSNDLLIKSEQAPMFEVTESRPSDWNIPLTSTIVRSDHGSNPPNIRSCEETNLIESEKFAVFKETQGGDIEDLNAETVNRDASENSQTTNDDEEFEMLG